MMDSNKSLEWNGSEKADANPLRLMRDSLKNGLSGVSRSTKSKLRSHKTIGPFYEKLAVQYRFYRSSMRPRKSARVFIRKGISRMEFFEILNERKIEYVFLRWWENLPEIPEGEDMDILVKDQDRDLMDDLFTFADNGTGLKCDIYTVTGSKYGAHKSLPYFQRNLAEKLLKTRKYYRGAYVPSPLLHFSSLSYHALFHKGKSSGLMGFGKPTGEMEHDYQQVLQEHIHQLGLKVELSVKGLFQWLKEQGYAPAEDTLSKLAHIRPELSFLQEPLFSDIRGGNLLVFVVRERLIMDGFLEDFRQFLSKTCSFDIIDTKMMDREERKIFTKEVRGGKWDKGPYRYSGGNPAALIVAYDYQPKPLTDEEMKTQPRMTNRNLLKAKKEYRDRLNRLVPNKAHYNGVHSSDNEIDGLAYISLLGEEFKSRVQKEVERRRERFKREPNVQKTLSFNSVSKVELVKHHKQLVIKKTFRPGKERFLARELHAAKELSQELDFIPPLVAAEDDYIMLPYYENKLEGLDQEKKKRLIACKAPEIIRIICRMHSRRLAFINFTPESLIITPEGELFCTGFSYLQKYGIFSPNLEEAFEISGIPEGFPGDYPNEFQPRSSSYKKVWEPYLGPWKQHLRENPELKAEVR